MDVHLRIEGITPFLTPAAIPFARNWLVRLERELPPESIALIRAKDDVAHELLVTASSALRAVDRVLPIDDVQGLPRRYWRLLLGEAP